MTKLSETMVATPTWKLQRETKKDLMDVVVAMIECIDREKKNGHTFDTAQILSETGWTM